MSSCGRRSASIVAREVADPRIGFVTITSVETTPDLRHAKVWVSVIGQPAERDGGRRGARAGDAVRPPRARARGCASGASRTSTSSSTTRPSAAPASSSSSTSSSSARSPTTSRSGSRSLPTPVARLPHEGDLAEEPTPAAALPPPRPKRTYGPKRSRAKRPDQADERRSRARTSTPCPTSSSSASAAPGASWRSATRTPTPTRSARRWPSSGSSRRSAGRPTRSRSDLPPPLYDFLPGVERGPDRPGPRRRLRPRRDLRLRLARPRR